MDTLNTHTHTISDAYIHFSDLLLFFLLFLSLSTPLFCLCLCVCCLFVCLLICAFVSLDLRACACVCLCQSVYFLLTWRFLIIRKRHLPRPCVCECVCVCGLCVVGISIGLTWFCLAAKLKCRITVPLSFVEFFRIIKSIICFSPLFSLSLVLSLLPPFQSLSRSLASLSRKRYFGWVGTKSPCELEREKGRESARARALSTPAPPPFPSTLHMKKLLSISGVIVVALKIVLHSWQNIPTLFSVHLSSKDRACRNVIWWVTEFLPFCSARRQTTMYITHQISAWENINKYSPWYRKVETIDKPKLVIAQKASWINIWKLTHYQRKTAQKRKLNKNRTLIASSRCQTSQSFLQRLAFLSKPQWWEVSCYHPIYSEISAAWISDHLMENVTTWTDLIVYC